MNTTYPRTIKSILYVLGLVFSSIVPRLSAAEPADMLVHDSGKVERYDAEGKYLGTFVSGLAAPNALMEGPDGLLYISTGVPGQNGTVERFDAKTGLRQGTFINLPAGQPARLFHPKMRRHPHRLRRHHIKRLLIPPNRDSHQRPSTQAFRGSRGHRAMNTNHTGKSSFRLLSSGGALVALSMLCGSGLGLKRQGHLAQKDVPIANVWKTVAN